MFFQTIPVLCSFTLCNVLGGLGNSWSAKKSLSPSSSSISSLSNEEQEKEEVSQVDVEDSKKEVEMDVEPSRMNKRKNTIMDLTTSRYALCKKSKKNIDSSTPSMRSLSRPLPLAFVPSLQASLVPISSDVDLPNTRQGNTSTDVSYSFIAFVGGSSRFMSFSPTTINKGKNTIMDLTTSRYVFCKKSRKNIDSSASSLSPLPHPLPSTQACLVSIFSDVDFPDTGQDNTSTNVSSGFMVFVDGSSRFMSISLTKVENRPICSLNFDNTKKAIMNAFFEEDPSVFDQQDRAVQVFVKMSR